MSCLDLSHAQIGPQGVNKQLSKVIAGGGGVAMIAVTDRTFTLYFRPS